MYKHVNLLALRLFVRVATHGSFSQAAAELNLLPSSASRHIAALEHALGQALFTRHSRAVRLTDAGQRYYESVREAIEQIDQAGEHIAEEDEPRGRLKVSAPPAFARRHLAPILMRFQERHPGVELDLWLTDTFSDPVEAGIDVSIRIGELNDSRMLARLLAVQHFVLCAAPSYLARHGTPRTPDELATHNCLVYQAPYGPQKWHYRSGHDAYAVADVDGNVRSNYIEYLLEMARGGKGIVCFPTWLASRYLERGELVPLLEAYGWALEPAALGIHAVYPANRQRSRKTQAFLQFLGEQVGEPPFWDGWQQRRG
ncbi:LysR family transcriptional regulator [Bacillus sp. NP157]|nr:LysR family transcriptional regulator [Bacillus sp. NP157]